MKFFAPGDTSPHQALFSNPLFTRLAAKVPGWTELLASAQRVHDLEAHPFPSESVESGIWNRAGRAALAGASLAEALAEVQELKANKEQAKDIDELAGRALAALSLIALEWLEAHQQEVTDVLDGHLQAIVARLRPEQPVKILGRPQAALAADSNARETWLKIGEAAAEFAEAYRLGEALAGPGGRPQLWLFSDYISVWPRFFMDEPLQLWDGKGFSHILPAEKPPWFDLSIPDLLIWIVENGVEIRAIDSEQRHDEELKIKDLAEIERNKDERLDDAYSTRIGVDHRSR